MKASVNKKRNSPRLLPYPQPRAISAHSWYLTSFLLLAFFWFLSTIIVKSQHCILLRRVPFALGCFWKGLGYPDTCRSDGGELSLSLLPCTRNLLCYAHRISPGYHVYRRMPCRWQLLVSPLAFLRSLNSYLYGHCLLPSSAVAFMGFSILSAHWSISFLCL